MTYRAAAPLRRCVRSVLRNAAGLDYRLEVLDNGSDASTREFLAKEDVPVRRFARNIGKAAALNRALAADAGRADGYLVLDDDAELPEGLLAALLKEARRRPKAAILGCRTVYPDGRIHSAEMFSWFDGVGHGELDLGQRSYSRYCDAVTGVCMLIRRGVFPKVRFWDRLRQPNEDGDFCLAARQAGLRIFYCGRLAVRHGNLRRYSRRNVNEPPLMRKWGVGAFRDSHPLDKAYAAVWNLERAKDWDGMASACRRLTRLDPAPVYAWGLLGKALLESGRSGEAREALEKALAQRQYKTGFTASLMSWRAQAGSSSPSLRKRLSMPSASFLTFSGASS